MSKYFDHERRRNSMGEIVGALIVTHTPRIADEATAPEFTREIIRGMPYDFPGDPEIAEAIAAKANASGVPAIATAAEPFMLEYGTVNPVQYLTPKFDVPVVPVSCCLLADLQECLRFGDAVGA